MADTKNRINNLCIHHIKIKMMQPHWYTNHHPSYLEVDHALTSCCIHIIWAKKVNNSNATIIIIYPCDVRLYITENTGTPISPVVVVFTSLVCCHVPIELRVPIPPLVCQWWIGFHLLVCQWSRLHIMLIISFFWANMCQLHHWPFIEPAGRVRWVKVYQWVKNCLIIVQFFNQMLF
jgi:hypothetical protein